MEPGGKITTCESCTITVVSDREIMSVNAEVVKLTQKFHPYQLRQNDTLGQKYVGRALDAAERQAWTSAKYWFDRAIRSDETCPKAFGEVGVAACDFVLSLEQPTPEQARQAYLGKQKELSSTIPARCLV
jgi:hypothetical protein